jgi:hypothetical protein
MNEYFLKLIKNLIKCYTAGFVFSLIFAVIVQLLPYGIGTMITDIFQLNLIIFGLIFSNLIYLLKYL